MRKVLRQLYQVFSLNKWFKYFNSHIPYHLTFPSFLAILFLQAHPGTNEGKLYVKAKKPGDEKGIIKQLLGELHKFAY